MFVVKTQQCSWDPVEEFPFESETEAQAFAQGQQSSEHNVWIETIDDAQWQARVDEQNAENEAYRVAFSEGKLAYSANTEENPYKYGTSKYRGWKDGWNQACIDV